MGDIPLRGFNKFLIANNAAAGSHRNATMTAVPIN